LEQEKKSLAVMQLAYAQDYLVSNSDLRALAQLYLYHSLPYRAGLVLEKASKDERIEEDAIFWEMLANSWLLAREFDRALTPLQTGAEISEKGSLYARLGQLYLEREQWSDASDVLERAIAKGGLHDEHTTHLLMAISLYHQKKFQNAIKHLKIARKSETEAVNTSASQWLLLVDRDVQTLREAQLEEAQLEEAPPIEEASPVDEAPPVEEASPADEAQPERAAQPEAEPQTEEVSQVPQ
jgi:tetratricopeptide (TPR) repeat protein